MSTPAAEAPAAQPSPEEVQRALAVADQMQQQLAMLEHQINVLQANQAEAARARRTLAGLRDAKPGDTLLMPVGGGAFTRATLADPGRVLAPVGAGVHVETTVDEAEKRLAEREDSTRRALERATQEADRIRAELEAFAASLQGLQG